MPTFRQSLKGRFAVFGIVILLVLGVLLVKLWTMQVLAGPVYAQQAANNRQRIVTTEAPRGRILDDKGRELVSNRATLAVTCDRSVADSQTELARLSTVLQVPEADLKDRASSVRVAALAPRVVAVDVSMQAASFLSEHISDFPGVAVAPLAIRKYPKGSLAAQVLGYTGVISDAERSTPAYAGYEMGDVVGKDGSEKEFEKVLQGDRGVQRFEVDAAGRKRRVIEEIDPVAGRDVKLTIDADVQKVAEGALVQALKDAHNAHFDKARAGSAVAIDVKTGAIVAMANVPTYNPQIFLNGISNRQWASLTATSSEYPLTNRAIMAQYPPASTFKGVTGLGGLQTHMISAGTTWDCKGVWTELGKQWKKYCWNRSGHGTEDIVTALRDSCDSFFYEVGKDFYDHKGELFQKFARKAGFGQTSGIDLPGEATGRVPDAAWKKAYNAQYPEYQQWLPGDTVNMAIGQGDLLVTPLQLADYYAGIGNGGNIMRPHVLEQILGSDGKPVYSYKPQVAFRTGASAANLSTIKYGLHLVTTDGTAKGAFSGFAVPVCGKTGTAQVYGKDDMAWFVGFAPAYAPRYCVVVVIEQGGHGGSVAAPAARDILAKLLNQPIVHVTASDSSR